MLKEREWQRAMLIGSQQSSAESHNWNRKTVSHLTGHGSSNGKGQGGMGMPFNPFTIFAY